MIKFSSLLLVGVTAVTITVAAKYVPPIQNNMQVIQKIEADTDSIQEKLSSVSSLLANYKEATPDLDVRDNLEIATTIQNLDGASLLTIGAVAVKGNGKFVCVEVQDVKDVEFFNTTAKEMEFTMQVSDLDKLVNSLNRSALVIKDFRVIDGKAIFSTDTAFGEPATNETNEGEGNK